MTRLQIIPTSWPVYILFLFVSCYLISSWTTTDINAINYALVAIKLTTEILISFTIGTQIAQLTRRQLKPQLLLWIGAVYLLLQLTYYPTYMVIDSSSWMLWFIPQGAGQFAAATFITLITVVLFRHQYWWIYASIPLLIATVSSIIFYQQLLPVIYLSLGTAAGFLIYSRNIASNQPAIVSGISSKPWFYVSLVATPLVANVSPIFFSDINLAVKYLLCMLASICILLVSASKVGTIVFYWFIGWIDWVSGNQTIENQASQQPITLYDFSEGHYSRWVVCAFSSVSRIAILVFLALLMIELPVRDWSFNSVISWVNDSIFFVVVSCIILFILYCIFRILLSRLASSLLLLMVIALLSSANTLKMTYLGVPLVPSDLHLIDQAFDSLIFILGKARAILIYSSIFFLVIIFTFTVRRYAKKLLNTNSWIGLRGLAAFFLLFYLLLQPEKLALSERLPNAWDMSTSGKLYAHAGFATGFLHRYQQSYIRAPENFSPTSISLLASSLNIRLEKPLVNQAPAAHIIIIQSEAFWDPGLLHEDLYPHGSPGNLARLCETRAEINDYCYTGYVEVPTFGGSTAHSEFEFLTGLSMHLLPPGTTPFVDYIQKPTPSIGWRAKQANYQTLGIHPNGGWFWNRDKVYPLLGIEEFQDISAFKGLPSNQLYVTDHAINQLITRRIADATQPQFIFAVTMANHAPFADQRYAQLENDPIDWEQLPALSADEQQAIKTYSIGVRESRLALEELIETYRKKDAPPVIIVFYGDHLPILGENYSIYHKAHFKTELMHDQFQEFFSTPFLVWSNQTLSRPLAASMTVSLLGQEIMDLAGLGNSGLHQLITQLQDSSLLRKQTRAQILNNEPRPHLTKQQKALAELYTHVSFDALFHQNDLTFFGMEQTIKQLTVLNK